MGTNNQPTVYSGKVEEVFSGDDLIVMVDLGVENLFKRQRVRLHGVDTPNAIGQGPTTPAGVVRAYVRNLCCNKQIKIEVISSKNSASWVAVIHIDQESGSLNLNEELMRQGYVYKRENH